jgi:hypothetical protein
VKVGPIEDRPPEIGRGKIGATEVDAPEVEATEVRAGEVQTREVVVAVALRETGEDLIAAKRHGPRPVDG